MKQSIVDQWIGLMCILGGGFWSYTAQNTITGIYEPEIAGPKMFPVFLGVLLIILGAVLVANGFIGQKQSHQGGSEGEIDKPCLHEFRIVISTFAVLMLYGFLLDKIGFLAATPMAIILTLIGVLKIYSWRLVVCMAAGLTIGCYVLFGTIVGTYLPSGTWW